MVRSSGNPDRRAVLAALAALVLGPVAARAAGLDRLTVWGMPASPSVVLARAVASLLGNDDPEIHVIGFRHGEKLHETLLSREEIVKASDEGDYFRVPLDARSLQYELYFDEGQTTISRNDDYTSENTYRLNVEETKQLLMRLPEMQKLVGANQ